MQQAFALVPLIIVCACKPQRPESRHYEWQQVPVMVEMRVAEKKPAPGLMRAVLFENGETVYLHSAVELANEQIARAEAVEEPDGIRIQFWLTGDGGRRFEETTGTHIGDYLAILINSRVISAPAIVQRIERSPEIPAQVKVRLPRHQALQLAKAVSQTWPAPADEVRSKDTGR